MICHVCIGEGNFLLLRSGGMIHDDNPVDIPICQRCRGSGFINDPCVNPIAEKFEVDLIKEPKNFEFHQIYGDWLEDNDWPEHAKIHHKWTDETHNKAATYFANLAVKIVTIVQLSDGLGLLQIAHWFLNDRKKPLPTCIYVSFHPISHHRVYWPYFWEMFELLEWRPVCNVYDACFLETDESQSESLNET